MQATRQREKFGIRVQIIGSAKRIINSMRKMQSILQILLFSGSENKPVSQLYQDLKAGRTQTEKVNALTRKCDILRR